MPNKIALCSIALLLFFAKNSFGDTGYNFSVLDADNGIKVASDIYLSKTDLSEIQVASIDSAGILKADQTDKLECKPGEKLYAKPLLPGKYYESKKELCAKKSYNFTVTRKFRYESIKTKAEIFREMGDHGKAAQGFSDLATRTPSIDLELKTLESLGKVFDVQDFAKNDSTQKKVVATPALVESIKKFQKENGLKEDGIAGSKTLNSIAKGTFSENYFGSPM